MFFIDKLKVHLVEVNFCLTVRGEKGRVCHIEDSIVCQLWHYGRNVAWCFQVFLVEVNFCLILREKERVCLMEDSIVCHSFPHASVNPSDLKYTRKTRMSLVL